MITPGRQPSLGGYVALGQIMITPGAQKALEHANAHPSEYLNRHRRGDWGIVSDSDWDENNKAVSWGDRLLSSYILPTNEKIWIITEADRSVTTFLLPDEY